MNLEPKIFCPKCFNIPLLGISFNEKAKNINRYIDLYSFCIFKHKKTLKTKSYKINLDELFSNNNSFNKNIQNNNEIYCESCNKKPFEYHCFDCKRNICKKCFEYDKNHKYYYNYEYIPQDELKLINEKLNKSKNNLDLNYSLISNIISNYETQLNKLKNLYAQFKKLNDNLLTLSSYILNKYIDLSNSQKPIYYLIYFNLKNILSFNPI